MRRLRNLWLSAHRWFALSLGWILGLIGLSGALLVIAPPLDEQLHPQLFRVPAYTHDTHAHREALPLETIRSKLRAGFGEKASFSFLPPREADGSLSVIVRGPWRGTLYLDPFSGAELGRRGESEGVVNFLFKLHSSLMLDDVGRSILAIVALGYLLLLASGLVLWWPRDWRVGWRIELHKGLTRSLFDLHRVAGATLGVVIAVSVATGAYMGWQPLRKFVTTISGATPLHAPALPVASRGREATLPLDTLVAAARAVFPDGRVYLVQTPAKADRPVHVRLHLPDDPHPNGRTLLWVDPVTGKVLAAQRWNQADIGARAVSVVYPLHTGALGGPLLEALVMLGGLALAAMSGSGLWLWWRRSRRVASSSRARASHRGGAVE
ncbi:PepSY domain-containing protein [Paraburkholderia sp. Ac-20342]|uniref:PepSY-associated TM helix domain-containing protein n=1 Tax=Paraburkholderia sp. Ac-20342 TaxID=2703889 RepID=UPI001980201F|nr:PepSY-associated TM helix domain-containing protein [Paraburkholderia sp. Ac-20342]MBN3849665.1 PepSY domain-containing protein [Paraburkholderia sp. Ac-20342]